MEKCKIFLLGVGDMDKYSEEINEFLSEGNKEITRIFQSSATWDCQGDQRCIGTHLTIFYKEE